METATERPNNAALIATAADAGHDISARTLELWRYRGLLPRPERQAGARALWLYPAGTERQLLRLLHWRERTRSHDQILVALWVEGSAIEQGRVREALERFVEGWSAMIEVEVAGREAEEEAEVVDRLARQLARMRGKGGLPRAVRMRLAEREAACGYMVASVLGMEEEVRRREADLPHLERMLGMRSGHDGGLSATMGLGVRSGEPAALLPSVAQIRESTAEASAVELELVRRIVGVTVVLVPLTLPILLGDQLVKAEHLIDVARELFADPPPAAFSFVVVIFLALLHAKEPALEDLEARLGALRPSSVARDLRALTTSPGSESAD
jgi:DNA-binding transcriptional MerR regulator